MRNRPDERRPRHIVPKLHALAATPADDLFQRLEQLNEIGASALRGKRYRPPAGEILLAAKTDHARRWRHALPGRRANAAVRHHAERVAQIAMGGTTGNPIPFYPVHLYDKEGKPNNQMVAAYSALTARPSTSPTPIRRKDSIFPAPEFRQEDRLPFQVVSDRADAESREPDHRRAAADQRKDPRRARSSPFSPSDQRLAESLASQAAIAITNRS